MDLFTVLRQLDIRTISFMVALATLLQAVMISFQLLFHQRFKGIGVALASNLCSAAGFLFLALREVINPVFTILIANTLIVGGVSLIYIAICQFTETRYHRSAGFLPPLLALPALSFFTYQQDSLVLRTALVSLLSLPPMALTAYTLFTCTQNSYSKAARLTAIPYAVCTLILFLRGAGVFLVPPHTVFEQSPAQIASFCGIFVLGNLWTIGFILMINQRLYNDLHAIASTDYLTQLLNRRAMMKLLEIEAARSKRNMKPFSVLLIDLDHFKGVNDTYGHPAGDNVLVEISNIFRSILRTQDHLARWGGEEFLVLLPETTLEQALAVGERLRDAVAAAEFSAGKAKISTPISISVGAVGTGEPDYPLEKILTLADQGLYLAKQTRNSVKSALLQPVQSQ